MDAFTEVYTTEDQVEFNDEFLYTVYKHRPPKDEEPLAALLQQLAACVDSSVPSFANAMYLKGTRRGTGQPPLPTPTSG